MKKLFIIFSLCFMALFTKANFVLQDTSKLAATLANSNLCIDYLFTTSVKNCNYFDSIKITSVSNDTIYVEAHTTPELCNISCPPYASNTISQHCLPFNPNQGITYKVSIKEVAHDGCTGLSTQFLKIVTIPMAICSINFTASNANNGLVNFNNISTGAATYLWHFGDGTTGAQLSPAHTYTQNAVYNVCLFGYNNNQLICDSFCTTVTVSNAPAAINCISLFSGSYDTTTCLATLSLTTSATISNIIWFFGDGTSATTAANVSNITHSYAANGV